MQILIEIKEFENSIVFSTVVQVETLRKHTYSVNYIYTFKYLHLHLCTLHIHISKSINGISIDKWVPPIRHKHLISWGGGHEHFIIQQIFRDIIFPTFVRQFLPMRGKNKKNIKLLMIIYFLYCATF